MLRLYSNGQSWVQDRLEVDGGPDGHPGPQGFYRRLGAHPEDEWTVWRLDGAALQQLGAEQG